MKARIRPLVMALTAAVLVLPLAAAAGALGRGPTKKRTAAKKAIFDGVTMDKLTYALLKSAKANVDNVTIENKTV